MRNTLAIAVWAVLSLFLSAVGPAPSYAVSLATIEDVKVSEDLKRVVIKFDRRAVPPTVFSITGPPRLVMDFEGVTLGKVPKEISFESCPLREVRAGKLPMGSRIVVDFGDYSVPKYKVRRMDNYFIVLLGDFTRESETARPEPADTRADVMPVSFTTGSDANKSIVQDAQSRLVIHRASVENESIVLEVSRRDHPEKSYKILLGVDFEQLGFNAASIRPVRGSHGSRKNTLLVEAAKKKLRMADGRGIGPRRGPVKSHAVRQGPAEPASIITRCSFEPGDQE